MTPYAFANRIADAALIVAAVNALPSLLDELERLRADNETLRRERDELFADCDSLGDDVHAVRLESAAYQTKFHLARTEIERLREDLAAATKASDHRNLHTEPPARTGR